MKKTFSIILALVLMLGFAPAIFAAGPMKPQITSNPPSEIIAKKYQPLTFNCDAYVDDGGTLSYTWWASSFPSTDSFDECLGKTKEVTYTWNIPGVRYVTCEVVNEKDGMKSESAFTSFTTVNISGIANPIINSEMPDSYVHINDTLTLWTDASPAYGEISGTLFYQWYRQDENGAIFEIPYANQPTFDVIENTPSVNFYYCVITCDDGIELSGNTETRKVRVEFYDPKPAAPIINSEMPNCEAYVGDELNLWCDASSLDGGELSYIWYKSDTPDIANIKAIDGTSGKDFKIKQNTPGVAYYCCGVWNNKNGEQSSPTYSRMIKVEYFNQPSLAPQKPVISKHPSETVVTVGETATISCDASSPDGGTLSYLWYKSSTPNYAEISAINNTNKELKIIETEPGVAYYCCGVWNSKNGEKSQPIYSNLVKVEFKEKEISPTNKPNTTNNTNNLNNTNNPNPNNTNNPNNNDIEQKTVNEPSYLTIVLIVFCILALALFIFLLLKNKKKDKEKPQT